MYKLQAFCALVLTLLAFSQESPIPIKDCLTAAEKEVKLLITNRTLSIDHEFFVPNNVQAHCTMQALHCFSYVLKDLLETTEGTIKNTLSLAIENLETIMEMKTEESMEKEVCSRNECKFPLVSKNTMQALDELYELLQRMYQAHR